MAAHEFYYPNVTPVPSQDGGPKSARPYALVRNEGQQMNQGQNVSAGSSSFEQSVGMLGEQARLQRVESVAQGAGGVSVYDTVRTI